MPKLTFDVLWHDSGAVAGFKNLSDSASKAEAGMKRLNTAAKVASVALGVAVVKFGKDSVKAFSESQEAQKHLAFAFQKFPALASTSQKALQGLNSELQKKTRFDDDAIASGQAVLAQFKLTGTQLKQVTPLLLDYAAKMGIDVPTAAQNVGKALLGNAKALKSIGINYKSTGDAALDFANITDLMRQKIGGFAELEGKTAAGQLAILKNQFGELQETAGSHLVPALTAVVKATNQAVVAFSELSPGMQAGITTLAIGIPTFALAVAGIAKVGTVARETAAALKLMGISARGATIAAGAVGAVLAGAAVLVGVWADESAKSKQAVDDFTAALKSQTSEIQKNVTAVAAKSLQDQGAFAAAKTLGLSLDTVTQAALGNADAMNQVNAVTDEAIQLGLTSADVDANIRANAANDLSKAVGGTSDAYNKAVGGAKDMASATGEAGQTSEQAAAQIQALEDALHKAAQAALASSNAAIAYEAAIDDATKAAKDNGKTLNINTEKGRANRTALNNLAAAGLAHVAALKEQNASTKTVNNATKDARGSFIRAAEAMGVGSKRAKDLADKYGLIPKKKETKFSTPGLSQAGADAYHLRRVIAGIPRTVTINYKNQGAPLHAYGGPIHRQGGGPVPGSSPNIRADNIPILATAGEFMMQVPATRFWGGGFMNAVNSGDLTQVRRQVGAMGGNTYIINAPNYVGDKRDLVKALTDLDRQGRLTVVRGR